MDIVVTIGPASWAETTLEALLELGVRLIRFPLSKETPSGHLKRCRLVRKLANRRNIPIRIIGDLPGGKPRLGNTAPITVSHLKTYTVGGVGADGCDPDFILDPIFPLSSLSLGGFIAIGDGENSFIVDEIIDGGIRGRFLRTGIVERRRAFLPRGKNISVSSFTEADKNLLSLLKGADFDLIALSFVDCAQDIEDARCWLRNELGWEGGILAKIESREGVANIEEVARVADAIMVARGDLALQAGFEGLWGAQRRVLEVADRFGRYRIAGTGFLESFSTTSAPSRAEVIDVCTALSMGADAIMLSGETTIGVFPLETVQFLRSIGEAWKATEIEQGDSLCI